jgi:hypothetical protein
MIDGALRFVRYALPPNRLGYCGPDRSGDLAAYLSQGINDLGLSELAAAFDGAWPYLRLIGDQEGLEPLDERVVDAYWLGGPSSYRVDLGTLGDSLRDRFYGRAGWPGLRDGISEGGRPTHAYHVFSVYPWVGVMRSGVRDPGLAVVDRCRVRWGRVLEVSGDRAVVECRPLELVGTGLALGDPRPEMVQLLPGDPPPATGAWVSMHWDWVCETLDRRQLGWLRRSHAEQLALANAAGATVGLAG